MKKIKYILFSVLLVLTFICLGELFVFNLDFISEKFIRTDFAVRQIDDADRAKNDFQQEAKENKLGIFCIDTILNDDGKVYKFYANTKASQDLNKIFKRKEYFSFAGGRANIRVLDFNQISSSEVLSELYFTNSNEDMDAMRSFKKALIDEYGGGFPHDYGSSKSFSYSQIGLFLLLILFIVFFDYFYFEYKKRELMVRLIQGEDLYKITLSNYFTSLLILILITLIVYYFLSRIYYLQFTFKILLLGLLIYSIVFLCMSLNFASIDTKKVLGGWQSENLIRASWLIKFISLVVFTLLFYNIFLYLKLGLDYKTQDQFFEELRDFHYYQMNYKVNNSLAKDMDGYDDSAEVHKIFNDKFYKDSILSFDISQSSRSNKDVILVNKQNLDLQGINFNIGEDIKDSQIIIFVPNKFKNYNREDLKDIFYSYYPKDISINESFYDQSVKIIAINNGLYSHRSKTYKNPILIFENKKISPGIEEAGARFYYWYHIPYKLKENDYRSFIEEHDLENQILSRISVKEYYNKEYKNIRRLSLILLGVSSLLLLLNITISSFIIKIFYQIKAKEYGIETLLGYSLFEKNKKIIFYEFILLIMSLFALITLGRLLGQIEPFLIILTLIIVGTIDGIIINDSINKNEKILLSKISKGGI